MSLITRISVAQWESVRKVRDGLTRDELFGFLTTKLNGVVGLPSRAVARLATGHQVAAILASSHPFLSTLYFGIHPFRLNGHQTIRQGD